MQKKDFSYYYDATDAQVISTNSISFKSLLYNVMCAVRTYCKHDIILVQKLLGMFNNLMETSKIANINYRSVVLHELDSLHEDISHVIKNKNDLEVLELEITAIKNKF